METSKKIERSMCIGITGGIGAGKSIVADIFERRGATLFHADDVAKELMNSDSSVHAALRKTFGNESFRQDGHLDTKFLAAHVFVNPEKLAVLNSIVHPAVHQALETAMKKSSTTIFAMDAALIYEAAIEEMFDYVVVVAADEETRVAHVMEREGCTADDVRRRIAMQMPQQDKIDAADFTLVNDGAKEELEAAADSLYTLLLTFPKRNELD